MINEEILVQLVDQNDNPIGQMEKLQAHIEAKMHRAVSLLIMNSKGEWLLHQRALEKYHSPGLWTNACCTHPFIGESYEDAIRRRLIEEMGMEITGELKHELDFTYYAKLNDNLIEHEYDRLFSIVFDQIPNPNPEEVKDWKYISFKELKKDIQENPKNYTEWFKIIFTKVSDKYNE
ncbi:MAG: isopentenyl-diphosphate Delta-isomerase [Bacteroidales bacterium]|jgi:isopentenyl-diphosphate delta-isomerase|nr:isopentenyl-diphosphate Delta-isomerase [Bacteroidales bacterium]MDD4703149.1 isopentenyl-diphosphate Delta-isomerase [Bacteroidales bacterium]MDX9797629.1 isopentenyl-diphosphate Delta-isomerase [Bacteroidales bacterium]